MSTVSPAPHDSGSRCFMVPPFAPAIFSGKWSMDPSSLHHPFSWSQNGRGVSAQMLPDNTADHTGWCLLFRQRRKPSVFLPTQCFSPPDKRRKASIKSGSTAVCTDSMEYCRLKRCNPRLKCRALCSSFPHTYTCPTSLLSLSLSAESFQ